MMFTGELTDCRIAEFAEIVDERGGKKVVNHFAIIQEKWGVQKWVRLLDPNMKNFFPVMKEGTAVFELEIDSRAVLKIGENGNQRAATETPVKILCLTDFKAGK